MYVQSQHGEGSEDIERSHYHIREANGAHAHRFYSNASEMTKPPPHRQAAVLHVTLWLSAPQAREHQARNEHREHRQNDRERPDAAKQVPAGIEIEQSRKDTRRHEQRQHEARQNTAQLRALVRVVEAKGQHACHHDGAKGDYPGPQRTEFPGQHKETQKRPDDREHR